MYRQIKTHQEDCRRLHRFGEFMDRHELLRIGFTLGIAALFAFTVYSCCGRIYNKKAVERNTEITSEKKVFTRDITKETIENKNTLNDSLDKKLSEYN